MKKILYTLGVVAPFAILQTVILMKDHAERKRINRTIAENCARNYANSVIWRMYLDDKIRDDEHKKIEWTFAYTTHLLENH
jgi:hypothetical protein